MLDRVMPALKAPVHANTQPLHQSVRSDQGQEIASQAWQLLGKPYDERAGLTDAPDRFSPTSFVVWLFNRIDTALPNDLLALHHAGQAVIGSDLEIGDLIFRKGPRHLFHATDERRMIGHVGVYVGSGVIHASPFMGQIVHSSMDWFIDAADGAWRGARRILDRPSAHR